MFLLLNGSFGIGKTTVAQILAREVPDAVVYDPERVGFILRRLPAWILGLQRQPEDYQDLDLWRRLVARGCLKRHLRHSTVIIPMAFTDRRHLNELAGRLRAVAPVATMCLVAPLAVVVARLQKRADLESGGVVSDFALRRSRECVDAHQSRDFGLAIDAIPSPHEIAAQIRFELGI